MFIQNLRAKVGARLNGDKEAGFTLIELLVVMLILGILAAIALPAFFNQKDKAGDAKAKEYAHSAQVAIETYFTDNGTYAGAEGANVLTGIEPTLASADAIAVTDAGGAGTPDNNSYRVTITASTGNTFSVNNVGGLLTYPCSVAAGNSSRGGCPTGNDWGG
jgi:type IV pilus assembly protein PilA